jgi:TolA-binding protein
MFETLFQRHTVLSCVQRSFVCWILSLLTVLASVGISNGQLVDQEYQLASGYYSRGQWDESAVAFEDFIKRYPDSHYADIAHFFLGESKIQDSNFAEAYVAFQTFLARQPRHEFKPRATFRMGEAALRIGKSQVALRMLESFVRDNPQHELVEYALPYLGELRLTRMEPKLAEKAYETALKIYPNSKLADPNRLGLAKSFQIQGKTDNAVRFYQYVASQSNRNAAGEAKLQLGMIKFEQGNFSDARKLLTEAKVLVKGSTNNYEVTYWLARTEMETGSYEKAHEMFSALKALPAKEDLGCGICYDAAVAALKMKDETLALEWLTKLRKTWPENRLAKKSMFLEIDILRRQGLNEVALDFCRQYRKQFDVDELRYNVTETMGRIYYEKGDYPATVSTFRDQLSEHFTANNGQTTAPKLQAQRATWQYLKSLGHIGMGEYDEAIKELTLADANNKTIEMVPLISLAKSTAQFGLKNYSRAIAGYQTYLSSETTGEEAARAYAELSICLAESDRWAEASSTFNKLADLKKGDPMVAATCQYLADKAYGAGEKEMATIWYERLADPAYPQEIVSRSLAGLTWLQMESPRSAKATALFERLTNEYPDSKFSAQAVLARAKHLDEQGDLEGASEMYDMVIRRFPEFDLAQIARLRQAYSLQARKDQASLESAKVLLETFMEQNNAEVVDSGAVEQLASQALVDEAIYQLAWVNHDLGEQNQAHLLFEQLVNDHQSSKYWPDAAYRVAKQAVAEKEMAKANKMIESLLTRADSPTEITARVLYLQAQMAASNNEWAKVSSQMRELKSKTKDVQLQAKANYWLAESLYRQDEFVDSKTIFESLQTEIPLLDEGLEPWTLLRIAQCEGKADQWTNTMKIAGRCLIKFPKFSAYHEFLFLVGRAHEAEGRLEEARKSYEQVVAHVTAQGSETAAIAQWRIGETFFHQENYAAAIGAYYRVDSLYDHPRWRSAALMQGAKCQEHLSNWRHAAKLYTQLVTEFPESEFTEAAKARLSRVNQLADKPEVNIKR